MLPKKKNMLKNSLILIVFFLLISACFWKMYMLCQHCVRIYFMTHHMKKKVCTFLNQTPSPQEIQVLQEKTKKLTKQKRTYIKKRDSAYLLIDWYLYIFNYLQHISIKQAVFNKKSIKLSIEGSQESDIELFLQYIVQNKIFEKAHVRSCEKTISHQISCEIYIPIKYIGQ